MFKIASKIEQDAWENGKIDRAFDSLRIERNQFLSQSDWTQMPDSPLSSDQKIAWANYRQALRDFPETVNDPLSPVWPEIPTNE